MREKERSWKTPAQSMYLLQNEKSLLTVSTNGLIYPPKQAKLPKYTEYHYYMKGILGKVTKKNSQTGTGSKIWKAGCEIFRNLAKFWSGPFSSVFCSSFLWFLICNTEFNSDSLCLS